MKQGELAKILDRSPMEIGRTRKKICNSDDFNEETKEKIRVCIPMNLTNHLTQGKIFEAQVIEYNGEKYYRHKKIRDGYYPRVHKKA